MIVSIMQPTFIPWIGYFGMIDRSDSFVFLNDVQMSKQSWQTRNKIRESNRELMLSIPIRHNKSSKEMLINQTQYQLDHWKRKHLKTFKQNYKQATYFNQVFSFLEEQYLVEHKSLADFNVALIKSISSKIGIKTKFHNSEDLCENSYNKVHRLTKICREINGEVYLTPKGSSGYLQNNESINIFNNNGIELFYFNFVHPIYEQLGNGFISHLSIVDLLFNEGFDNALSIIRLGYDKHVHYNELIY